MQLADLTVYHDDEFVRYGDAKVGLLTHGLQYGTGCFEGIRGSGTPARTSSICCSSTTTTAASSSPRGFC